MKLNNKMKFNPGSDEAVKEGCTCAVMDNNYGSGSGWLDDNGDPAFWVTEDCPVHYHKATKIEPKDMNIEELIESIESFIDIDFLESVNYDNYKSELVHRLKMGEDAIESINLWRTKEKLIGEAYLRIRKLVGAWDTCFGGFDRFEVTENKIKELIKKANSTGTIRLRILKYVLPRNRKNK